MRKITVKEAREFMNSEPSKEAFLKYVEEFNQFFHENRAKMPYGAFCAFNRIGFDLQTIARELKK